MSPKPLREIARASLRAQFNRFWFWIQVVIGASLIVGGVIMMIIGIRSLIVDSYNINIAALSLGYTALVIGFFLEPHLRQIWH